MGEQEEERHGEEEQVDRGRGEGTCVPEDQGLRRGEEGNAALQEGQGVHGLSSERYVFLITGLDACSGLRGYPAACLSDGRPPGRFVSFGPAFSCTPTTKLR